MSEPTKASGSNEPTTHSQSIVDTVAWMAKQGLRERIVERIEMAALVKDGIVYAVPRPGRHDAVIRKAHNDLGLSKDPVEPLREDEQGFVTNTGRFVDRIEGAQLALAAKQIERLKWPPLLYSEDLW